ncbi:MAG: Fic family protein [Bacteroidota bacterium]
MKIPQAPPALTDWTERQKHTLATLRRVIAESARGPAPDGRYRHWDTLRHITPPNGLTSEDWWAALKLARQSLYRPMPLMDKKGDAFQYALVDPVLEGLHQIDRDLSGHMVVGDDVLRPETRDRYLLTSLVEEAITSSQLEGASTTRVVAKEMIRTERAPRTTGERMILNNYRAMQFVQENRHADLSPDFVERLHRILTQDTLEGPAFRQPGDGIAVYSDTDVLLHQPPPAHQITERMKALCDFANGEETVFLHPVTKAIVLHFWLAYDHPFRDGNGRTARALFYWYMLKRGFWLAEFISISRILKNAPARYAKAFLYTETDGNDLTYFILSQLRVLHQSTDSLKAYLRRKTEEIRQTKASLQQANLSLNHRQIALLSHAQRHPGYTYTIAAHQRSHGVVYQTARTDLLDLVERGLLMQGKQGRTLIFDAPADLASLLEAMG